MTARNLLDSSSLICEETQNTRQNKRKNTVKFVLGLTVVCVGTYCCFVLGPTVVLCWDFLLFCVGTYCCFVLGLTVVFLNSYEPYHIF